MLCKSLGVIPCCWLISTTFAYASDDCSKCCKEMTKCTIPPYVFGDCRDKLTKCYSKNGCEPGFCEPCTTGYCPSE